MGYVFTAIVLIAVIYSIYKVILHGKLPSNNYTPFDDLAEGKADKDDWYRCSSRPDSVSMVAYENTRKIGW